MANLTRRYFIKSSTSSGLSLAIKNPKNSPLPPPISSLTFNEQGGFDPETVVSRNIDGSISSRFKDSNWDFSALASSTSRNVVMYFEGDESLVNELKTLMLLVMLTPISSPPQMDRYFQFYFSLKRIAEVIYVEEMSLKMAFNTRGGIRILKLIQENLPYSAQDLISISDHLHFIGEELGFKHGYKQLGRNVTATLRKVAQKYMANSQQNPVIPSRILKAIYHETIAEYEALLPVLDELLAMQAEVDAHPMTGLSLSHQKNKCQKYFGASFGQLKERYSTNFDLGLKYPLAREFMNRNFNCGLTVAHENDFEFDIKYKRQDILKAINYIQRVCQDVIIMFTGMRPAEACLLPYFGSKETYVDGVKYWLIYGFALKKRADTPPFEMWVTNKYGYRAFQTAKCIADLYYSRNDRQPIEVTPDGELTPDLSPLYLRDKGKIDKRIGTFKKTPAFSNSYLITKDDLDELKTIDPHRKWEGEPKFGIGKPFPVELRLFRRSIAFFASASGVRFVDLKNQYHHLFESQTFYYGQGSGRANPFLKDKESFASYFNQVKHEAEAFSFINEVINFDGKLFGASAIYAERNDVFYSTIRDEDRAETVKRFKRGELAYTETHLGGCKTLEPCKSKALGSVSACLSCKDADIRPAKLAHAIKDQAEFVDGLNPDRLEFRTEIQELIVMLDFSIKNIDKAMKDLDRRKDEYKQFRQWAKEFKQMRKCYQKKVENSEKVT